MARRIALLALSALLGIGLGACSSDEAATAGGRPEAARTGGRSSDAGSRYLDVAGPVGGLTAETPPVVGRSVSAPAAPAQRAPSPTVAPRRPVTRP